MCHVSYDKLLVVVLLEVSHLCVPITRYWCIYIDIIVYKQVCYKHIQNHSKCVCTEAKYYVLMLPCQCLKENIEATCFLLLPFPLLSEESVFFFVFRGFFLYVS